MSKLPERASKKPTQQLEREGSDDLAEEISKRISNLIPQGQRAQVVAQVVSVVQEERFSGPLPHPKHLREYEDICPGAADRIIRMAEQNLDHHQQMQKAMVEGDIADGKSGRFYGFCALLALIIAASVAGYFGHDVLAGAFVGAGALGVIGKFIQGRRNDEEDE